MTASHALHALQQRGVLAGDPPNAQTGQAVRCGEHVQENAALVDIRGVRQPRRRIPLDQTVDFI
jgi:hypothetical protein